MNRRVEMSFEKNDRFIKLDVSRELAGVLYVNGEGEVVSWIAHHVPLQKTGTAYIGKDILKEGEFKIPLDIKAEIKSIGTQKTVNVRTGRYIKKRVPRFVKGEYLVQPETWTHLTNVQKNRLKTINVWDVHDELVSIFSKGSWTPSWYIGALQQILNKVQPKEKIVPEIIQQKLNSLTKANITLHVNDLVFHFTQGTYLDCNGQIVRSFAFTLDRTTIIKKYLAAQGYMFKWGVKK